MADDRIARFESLQDQHRILTEVRKGLEETINTMKRRRAKTMRDHLSLAAVGLRRQLYKITEEQERMLEGLETPRDTEPLLKEAAQVLAETELGHLSTLTEIGGRDDGRPADRLRHVDDPDTFTEVAE